jgi:hypothetical protein
MAHDVFISSAAEDKLVATTICETLESKGVPCWIAPRNVRPGAIWEQAIMDAISASRAMVLVFSEYANLSTHVQREVGSAFHNRTTVIPIRISDTELTGVLAYYLRSMHRIDAFPPPIEGHLKSLAVQVGDLISESQTGAAGSGGPAHSGQSPARRATTFYEYALGRFSTVVGEEQLDIAGIGFLDLVLVLDGASDRKWYNDDRFVEALILAYPNPNLSASYIWKLYQGGDQPKLRPYTIAGTYEQLLFLSPPWFSYWGYADFMIFDPSGCFFVRKAFPDDVWKGAEESKGQYLKPVTQLLLVSEAFVVGSKYAQALGYGTDTQLYFLIRWSGLRGRKLVNRNPIRDDYYRASAPRDNHVQLDVTLPIQPSKEEVIQKTTEAVQDLGRAFGGYPFPEVIAQNEVTKFLAQT